MERTLCGWRPICPMPSNLWETGLIKKNVVNAAALGLLSGLIGIGIWKMALKKHPSLPKIDLTKYFLQLVPAHIILAICETLTSMLLTKKRIKIEPIIQNLLVRAKQNF